MVKILGWCDCNGLFIRSDAISVFFGHTIPSLLMPLFGFHHRWWCFSMFFFTIFSWFSWFSKVFSSMMWFFAQPTGPMFLRFIDHCMWLFLIRAAQVVPACQPGCEKMEREWENEEEMEREWGNGERFTLYISSFSLYFLLLYPFPISKIVSFCRKMLNTALLSRMSQKT